MARKSYVSVNGEWVEKEKWTPPSDSPAFYVMGDQQPYVSVVTGEVIGGRRQHREHLRAHDLVEVGNEKVKQKPIPDVPGRKEAIIDAIRRAGRR
jgi:hypothetical protein